MKNFTCYLHCTYWDEHLNTELHLLEVIWNALAYPAGLLRECLASPQSKEFCARHSSHTEMILALLWSFNYARGAREIILVEGSLNLNPTWA